MPSPRNLVVAALMLGASIITAPAAAETEPAVQDIVDRASAAAYYQGKDGKAKVSMTIADARGRERSRESGRGSDR